MRRISSLNQSVLGAFLLALVINVPSGAEENPTNALQLALKSNLEMIDPQGKPHEITGETLCVYSLAQAPGEVSVAFKYLRVKARVDNQVLVDSALSGKRHWQVVNGKVEDVPVEKASEPIQKMLKECYDTPLCKIKVDAQGAEQSREIVAGAIAQKVLVEQGQISNARLFHPPFYGDKPSWESNAEVSIGNGGVAKGNLKYERAGETKDGKTQVKVTGLLSNDRFVLPQKTLVMTQARYEVAGEQTYDAARHEWTSGELNLKVSFRLEDPDGKQVQTAKGTMNVKLTPATAEK